MVLTLVKRALELITRVFAILACLVLVLSLSDSPVLERAAPPASSARSSAQGSSEGARARLCVQVLGADDQPIVEARIRAFAEESGRLFVPRGELRGDRQGRACWPRAPQGGIWVLGEAPGLARASAELILDRDRTLILRLGPASKLTVTVTDEQSSPLAGATVLVTGTDPLPYGKLADAQGRASFDRLVPAPWTVFVAAPGYESATRPGVTGDLTVSLRRLAGLDVQVIGPDKKPVPDAEVVIAGAKLWPARLAHTESDGVAKIRGLEAGAYDLRARHGNLVSPSLLGFSLARGARESVTLELQPGRMIQVVVTEGEGKNPFLVPNADVVLVEGGISFFPIRGRTGTNGTVTLGPIAPGPATVSAYAQDFVGGPLVGVPDAPKEPVQVPLLKGGTLRGEVVDAKGTGIDGASVEVVGTDRAGLPIAETPQAVGFRALHFEWAMPGPPELIPAGELGVTPGPVPPIPALGAVLSPAPPGEPSSASMPAPWVSAFDGKFVARPVTPGRVRALVRHPEYVEGASEVVALGPGGEASVKVVLLRGGHLEGRVVDEGGYPVFGVRVSVVADRGMFEHSMVTAGDGAFAFAAVPAEVTVSASRADDPGRVAVRRSLEIPEGGRVDLELTLPAPRDAVRILVRDESEAPVPMAEVRVASLDPEAPLRKTLFTDENGRAELGDALGLALRIIVDAPGFAVVERSLDRAPAQLTIELDSGVIVTGRVTAVRGRWPVSGAVVTVRAGSQRRSTMTNADGEYRLEGVGPGAVTLTASHPEYATVSVQAQVARTGRADRPLELDPIDLTEPGRVEGRVVDQSGQGVDGARVAVNVAPAYLPAGALPPGVAVTDTDGHFTLSGLVPGTVRLEAYAPSVGRGRIDGITVDSDRTTSGVVIQLTEPAAEDEPLATGGVAVTLGERGSGDALEVVVVQVASASEAERGGLLAGDVLDKVDGARPSNMGDARHRLAGRAGSDVVLDVTRGGTALRLQVTREAVRR